MVLIKNTGLSSLPWKNPYSQNWKLGLSDKHPLTTYVPLRLKNMFDPPDGITPKNRPSFDQTRLSSQHRPKTLCFLRCNLLKMMTWSRRGVCYSSVARTQLQRLVLDTHIPYEVYRGGRRRVPRYAHDLNEI